MRSLFFTLVFLSGWFGLRADELLFDFSKEPLNEQPKGFKSMITGEGQPGTWRILQEYSATGDEPVLAQVSREPTDEHFPILVYDNAVFEDFTFSTRFKTVAGRIEQMAGIVFRFQDEKNYYYLRASAKGNTFRFSKIVGGQRNNPIGPEIQIPSGVWHELKVECKANEIRCFLNGQQVIPTATDNSFRVGKVGFWTKSDSVSYFKDARVEYTPREMMAKKLLADAQKKYPRVLAMKVFSKAPGKEELSVVASTKESEIGTPAGKFEKEAMEKNAPFVGKLKEKHAVVVTLPVHDRNGEPIAALRIEMKSFPGEMENNAVARALPIAKTFESWVTDAKDLF